MDRINNLSLERLNLVSEYIRLQQEFFQKLDSARIEVSKAKTLHGLQLSAVSQPSYDRDLEPTIRVNVNDNLFSIIQQEEEKPKVIKRKGDKEPEEQDEDAKKKEEEAKKKELEKKLATQFRPFGILEPSPAKTARKLMSTSFEIVCELASVQASINKIDDEMKKVIQDLKKQKDISAMLSSISLAH